MTDRKRPERTPDWDPYNRGDHIHGDVRAAFPFNEESFNNLKVRITSNIFDIASHYTFSPERLRLFRNGSRAFPQYNSISQFNDAKDVFTLKPDAGDTMHIETAESVRYIVNYISQISQALSINQSLQAGDKVRLGAYDGTDGWLIEQRGADHTDTQVDIIENRAGERRVLESDVELASPLTDWTRFELNYNWYNVGNQEWRQTITEDGDQDNVVLTRTSLDGERGPETGNVNIWVEVEADSGTTGLELNSGSMGALTLGNASAISRSKPQYVDVTLSGTADTWEPVYALRTNPNNGNVNSQFTELELLDYGPNDTLELVAVSFHESKTDIADTDWSVPEYHHESNSVIQSTTAVSQVANESGTVTDLGSSEKFGGYTIASATDVDGGNISGTSQEQNTSKIERKNVLSSDHIVFLGRSGTVDGQISFVWDISQTW